MAIRRAARIALFGAAGLAVLLAVLLFVGTRTQPGVERAGRFALDRIRGSIHGELTVDRITSGGTIVSGVTLHGVRITDEDGRHFLEADSARLTYRLWTLLRGAIVFDRLVVFGPDIAVEKLPGQERWNYQRVLEGEPEAPDTAAVGPGPAEADGDDDGIILIRDITIHGGRAAVRRPWEPEGPVAPADTARMIFEEVPGGLAQVWRFEEVEARLPRIVWDAPGEDAKLIEIGELSTLAYIWNTPAEIREAEGQVTLRDSVVSVAFPRARLPNSEYDVAGRIIIGDEGNRYDMEFDGSQVAFADLRWIYPPLPAEGGGSGRFRMQTQESGAMLWLMQDARLRTRGSEVAGSFGLITGDTLYFTNVDLEASPLDIELLRQLVPNMIPLEGLLIGTVEVDGPVSALETRGDATLTAFGDSSRFQWSGLVGLRRPYTAYDVDLDVRNADLERLARFAPELRLRGLASGRVRASGSLERGLGIAGDVALDRNDERSEVHGSGMFAVGGDRSAFDLRFGADSVALDLLTEQFPGLGPLSGRASGPVTVTGSLDDLQVDAELDTPAGGLLLRGRFAFAGEVPRYRADGTVTAFELHRIVHSLPETVVSGVFQIDGEGATPETIRGTAMVDLAGARVATVAVERATARGQVADGMLRLDSLSIDSEIGQVRAKGSFGVMEGRDGDLTVVAHGERLNILEPVLFPDIPDDPNASITRVAGNIDLSGALMGSVAEWSARGRAAVRGLVYDRLYLGAGVADFLVGSGFGAVEAHADSIRHGGRRLSAAGTAFEWSQTGGRFDGSALGIGRQHLEVEGTFERGVEAGDPVQVALSRFRLTARDGVWTMMVPATARVGGDGVSLDSLVLERSPDAARIRLAGTAPWHRPGEEAAGADMALDLERVRVGELLRVTQTDTTLDGMVSGRVRLTGTALDPVIDGRVAARPFRYAGAVFDSAGAAVRYESRRLDGTVTGWVADRPTVYGSGLVPIDMTLADRQDRLLDAPLTARFQADSLPAGLVSFLMPGFEEVRGLVDGEVTFGGTGQAPRLGGQLRLSQGSAFFLPLGVLYDSLAATATVESDTVIRVDALIATGRGRGRVTGTVGIAEPRDPSLDLELTGQELLASDRRDVVATVTGDARVRGRYSRPIVSGDLRILEGEMDLDEVLRQYQMVHLDPSLFEMIDSATVAFRPPERIPFLDNLLITGTTITADRGFWLRSLELNVEVRGTLLPEVDRQLRSIALTGTLQAVTGDYAFNVVQGVPARIFAIRSGTIEFVGTPGIDPNLDMEARYRVRRAQGDPINVVAMVTGTLLSPRVNLSSDSDLPLSESDLASYILFGRSGAELTQAQSDVVSHGIGLVRPVATGLLSSELQRALSGTGLPIDHIAFTTPEYGLEQLGVYWQDRGLVGVFHNTQLEVGIDAGPDLSLVGSVRIPTDGGTTEGTSAWRMFGARVEWRFRPSWTSELYIEDRFARIPSFGLAEIDDRKVWGLSLFRDWGY